MKQFTERGQKLKKPGRRGDLSQFMQNLTHQCNSPLNQAVRRQPILLNRLLQCTSTTPNFAVTSYYKKRYLIQSYHEITEANAACEERINRRKLNETVLT